MGVFQGNFTQQSAASIAGDLTIGGDLFIAGQIDCTSDNDLNIVDSVLILNDGEAGAGVTTGTAGIQIDRGSSTDFQFVFIESDDKFKAGEIGALKVVTMGDVGTAGYIPFGKTGGGELTEESNLFWDDTNNRLGLNNATPSTTLDVTGTGAFSGDLTLSADLVNSGEFDISSAVADGASALAFDFDTSVSLVTAGANLLKVRNNTVDRMTLDKDGALTISAAVTSSSGTSSLAAATVTGDLTVDTNSLKVDSGNNRVGIGQATPTVGFEVAFDSLFTSTGYIQLPSGSVAQRPTPANGMIRYNSDSNIFEGYENSAWTAIGATTDHGGLTGLGDDDHTIYSLADGTRSFTGQVTVTSGGLDITGDVGIGTSAPDGALHVMTASAGVVTAHANGDDFILENNSTVGMSLLTTAGNTCAMYFGSTSDNDAGALFYATSNDLMTFRTGGASRMYLTSAGLLGIGTNAPDGTLHAMTASAGTITAANDADELVLENSGNAGLTILSGNTSTANVYFGDDGANAAGRIAYDNNVGVNTMSLYTAEALAVTIDSSGNVGVGTAAPDGVLHAMSASAGAVTAANDADELILENSANTGMTILAGITSTASIFMGDSGDNAVGRIVHDNNGNLMSFSADSGTNTPLNVLGSAVLMGSATASPSASVRAENASTTTSAFQAHASNALFVDNVVRLTVDKTTNSDFNFLEAIADADDTATTEFVVDGLGRVGIGKQPGSPLDISLPTQDFTISDAGNTDTPTEQAWVEVSVNGVTGYLRVYATN